MIRRIFTAIILMAAASVMVGLQAQAQQAQPLTDEHVQRIRDNCQQANRTLSQLRVNDKLLRVNRAQLYDSISSKLMARLNSRLALNRLDGAKLVSVTAHYDRTLADFRSHYTTYEDKLIDTMRINCKKEPVKFYNSVVETRELRAKVNATVKQLSVDMAQYKTEFDAFRSNFSTQNKTREE